MSEFIGSRISLISKSDIRYVGVLHEINSENSSVALENVKSFGTEGRKQSPEEEIPASDNIYEYIVFRGSDVKDLRIEEAAPKENKPPPQIPNDPAILGAGSRPQVQQQGFPQNQQHQQFPQPQHQNFAQQQQFPLPGSYPPFQQPSRFAPPGGPHGFPGAPGGIPSYPGFNGPPGGFGGPPGWYGPGQGFPPNQNPFSPHGPPNIPVSLPGQQQQQQLDQRILQPSPIGIIGQKDQRQNSQSPAKPPTSQVPDAPSGNTTAGAPSQQGPPPPVDSKPDIASVLAPPSTSATASQPDVTKSAPTGPKGKGGIIPVVPLTNPIALQKPNLPTSSTQHTSQTPSQPAANAALNYQNATQAATAAVAAAMAKLPPAPGQPTAASVASTKPKQADTDAIQHLAKKVSEMRTDAHARQSRQPGTGGFAARGRGRGRGRGGLHDSGATRGIDVPASDYDFETANKKFNKQDLVKEAIASGSPLDTPEENGDAAASGTNGMVADDKMATKKEDEVVIPPAASMYNRASSFFDDISSDLKDRDESKVVNGREMRSEERKKNFETFGQGSVDGGGYRGGYRGRGRGRGGFRGGRGYQGRGGGYRGRGGSGVPNGTVMNTGT